MITWSPATLAAPAGGGATPWSVPPDRFDAPLDRRPDVAVVGAGIAGAAVAYACARAGLRVQVIDRNRPGSGVTQRSAGALIPDVHAGRVHPLLTDLGQRGAALHRKLAADLGHRLERLDWLDLRPHTADAAASSGPGGPVVRHLGADEVRERVPGLGPSLAARLVPDQAQIDPVETTAALLAAAGNVTTDTTALECRPLRGGALELRTTRGTIRPGWVVIATGQLPKPLADRVQGVRGHLVAVDVDRGTLPPHLGLGSDLVVLPWADQRLVVGGTRDGSTPTSHPMRDVVEGIRQRLTHLLPATEHAPTSAAWVGFRPTVADGLPVVDHLPETDRGFVIGGLYHTGLLLAPAIAELIVATVGGDQQLPPALGCAQRHV